MCHWDNRKQILYALLFNLTLSPCGNICLTSFSMWAISESTNKDPPVSKYYIQEIKSDTPAENKDIIQTALRSHKHLVQVVQ